MSHQQYLSELRQLPTDLSASLATDILHNEQVDAFLTAPPAATAKRSRRPIHQRLIFQICLFRKWQISIYSIKSINNNGEGQSA